MGVIRVKKEKNYTSMCNYHFREKEMSLKAKGLLSWMLSLPDNWDYSIKGMCKCHKDGEDAITSALKELQRFGYLEVVKLIPGTVIENSDGSSYILNRIDYDYIIHEKPINPQDTGFQCTENSVTEFSASENPQQINTKVINTKVNKVIGKPITPDKPDNTRQFHSRDFRKTTETLTDELNSIGELEEKELQKKEKQKTQRKKTLYQKCMDEIDNPIYNFDDSVKQRLKDFLPTTLQSNKYPVKGINQWTYRLKSLIELSKVPDEQMKIIEYSISHSITCFINKDKRQHTAITHKEGNQVNVVMSDKEWARRAIQEAIDNGEEFY